MEFSGGSVESTANRLQDVYKYGIRSIVTFSSPGSAYLEKVGCGNAGGKALVRLWSDRVFMLFSAKTKRARRQGDGKKMSRQFATNVTTIYDI